MALRFSRLSVRPSVQVSAHGQYVITMDTVYNVHCIVSARYGEAWERVYGVAQGWDRLAAKEAKRCQYYEQYQKHGNAKKPAANYIPAKVIKLQSGRCYSTPCPISELRGLVDSQRQLECSSPPVG